MTEPKEEKKAVILSIRPEWCRKILLGEKTIEVRKTRPKIYDPFKCYIYCTHSGSNEFFKSSLYSDIAWWNGEQWGKKKGHVVGEFICNRIYDYTAFLDFGSNISEYEMLQRSCLTKEQIKKYENPKVIDGTMYCGVHAWSIEKLVVYDTPKALNEFGLIRAPQSWAYCKEIAA